MQGCSGDGGRPVAAWRRTLRTQSGPGRTQIGPVKPPPPAAARAPPPPLSDRAQPGLLTIHRNHHRTRRCTQPRPHRLFRCSPCKMATSTTLAGEPHPAPPLHRCRTRSTARAARSPRPAPPAAGSRQIWRTRSKPAPPSSRARTTTPTPVTPPPGTSRAPPPCSPSGEAGSGPWERPRSHPTAREDEAASPPPAATGLCPAAPSGSGEGGGGRREGPGGGRS